MAEYIEKDYSECITKHRVKHFVCEFCNEHCSDEPCEPSDCEWMQYIDSEPAANVVPVVHGRWESVKNPQWPAYSHDKCSICGWWNTKNALCYDGHKKPGHRLNYCPNCGARMDGE